MIDAIQILTLVVCIAGLALIVLAIVLVMRALRLVNTVQEKLDKEISPLVTQVSETLARVNAITTQLSHTLDVLGTASQFAGNALTKLNPVSAGQAAAMQTGRTIASWVAMLAKTVIASRQKKKTEAEKPSE